jgi:hypothetical protein
VHAMYEQLAECTDKQHHVATNCTEYMCKWSINFHRWCPRHHPHATFALQHGPTNRLSFRLSSGIPTGWHISGCALQAPFIFVPRLRPVSSCCAHEHQPPAAPAHFPCQLPPVAARVPARSLLAAAVPDERSLQRNAAPRPAPQRSQSVPNEHPATTSAPIISSRA